VRIFQARKRFRRHSSCACFIFTSIQNHEEHEPTSDDDNGQPPRRIFKRRRFEYVPLDHEDDHEDVSDNLEDESQDVDADVDADNESKDGNEEVVTAYFSDGNNTNEQADEYDSHESEDEIHPDEFPINEDDHEDVSSILGYESQDVDADNESKDSNEEVVTGSVSDGNHANEQADDDDCHEPEDDNDTVEFPTDEQHVHEDGNEEVVTGSVSDGNHADEQADDDDYNEPEDENDTVEFPTEDMSVDVEHQYGVTHEGDNTESFSDGCDFQEAEPDAVDEEESTRSVIAALNDDEEESGDVADELEDETALSDTATAVQRVHDVPNLPNGILFRQAFYVPDEEAVDESNDETDAADTAQRNRCSRIDIMSDSSDETHSDGGLMEDEDRPAVDMSTLIFPVEEFIDRNTDADIFDRHAIESNDDLHVIADLDYLGHTHECTVSTIRSCKHDVFFNAQVPLRLTNTSIMVKGRIMVDCDGNEFKPIGMWGKAVGPKGVPLQAFKNFQLCKVTTQPNIEFSVSVFKMNEEFVPTDPHCTNETLETIALVFNTVKKSIVTTSAFKNFAAEQSDKARELVQILKATAPFRVLTSKDDSPAYLNLEGHHAQVFFEAYQEVLYTLAIRGVVGAMMNAYKADGSITQDVASIQKEAGELCFSSLTHATCAGLKHKLMNIQPAFNIKGDNPKEFHQFSQKCLDSWRAALRTLSDGFRNEPFWSGAGAPWLVSREAAPVTTLDIAYRISYINKEGEAISLLIDGRKGAGQCSAQRRCKKVQGRLYSLGTTPFVGEVETPVNYPIKFDELQLGLQELAYEWNTQHSIPTQVWEELKKRALQPKFFADKGKVTLDESLWDMDTFDWEAVANIDTSYIMSILLDDRKQNRGLRRRPTYPDQKPAVQPFDDSDGEEAEPEDPFDDDYVPEIFTEPDDDELQHVFDTLYDERIDEEDDDDDDM
jgi:hypothetical protein